MNRIAFKIATVVALTAGATVWMISQAEATAGITAVVSGAAAYLAVAGLITRRLKHIEAALNDLLALGRRETETLPPGGDELSRLIRRSDQAAHAIRKRLIEMNQAESYRREYVGDVSHEIKTPVFAIQGFAETLLGGAISDPEVNRGFVEKILQNANRLTALAKDLSEISRLETGALKLSMTPFRVRPVVEEVRDSLEIAARKKDISIDVHTDTDAVSVEGDRERIRQVLANLIDNAIKYSNAGGRVNVQVRGGDAGEVVFSVEDTGIGIEPEDISRITERFYRVDRSRSREQGGTGLGLSIVKHILAAHGTSLRIESRAGEGSVFSFALPAA